LKRTFVKPACVDFGLFHFDVDGRVQIRRQYGFENKIVCVFAGKFGGTYLDKEVFDFFKMAQNYWGDRFRVLLLTAHNADEIKKYCASALFDYESITHLTVKYEDVHKYLSAADFGLNPVKPTPSKQFCTPMKDGEYWACGLPVVITKGISDDSSIIADNKIGSVICQLNKEGYENAIMQMNELLREGEALRSRVQETAKRFRHFAIAEEIYSGIYG
jgi:glycosyltransferase involved in cell wall biosynthesis